MLTKELKLILAVALQLVVIFGIIIYKMSIITTGTAIILKTQPVDPRDFLRGDYISLRYEINQLDLNKIEGGEGITFKNGNPVYAELEKIGEYFSVKRISTNNPHSKYFIRGRVASNPGGDLTVIYGIEKYFVPEGRGRNLEALLRNRSSGDALLIGVKVNSLGDAVIDKIMIGGKEIDAFDFKKVDAETQVVYDAETKKQNNEHEQIQDGFAKSERNKIRFRDIERIKSAIGFYNLTISSASGAQTHFLNKNMPKTVIQPSNTGVDTFEVPTDPLTKESYVWIDNTGASSGYCFYAILETSPVAYYVASSESDVINAASNAPQILGDCGIKKPAEPIASIEGYVFIDVNKNQIFDKSDILYNQLDMTLVEDISSGDKLVGYVDNKNRKTIMATRPNNGHYKFDVAKPGGYFINADFVNGSGVHSFGPVNSNNCNALIKGGEKITNCDWMIIFD